MTFLVFLPGKWPSLNEMKDGAQRGGARGGNKWNKIKRAYGDPAQLLIRAVKRHLGMYHVRPLFKSPVIISYAHRRDTRRGDPDNFAGAAQKIINDSLVREGIIEDDTFAYIAGLEHAFEFGPFYDNRGPGITVEVRT